MDKIQAMQVIREACASVIANFQTHQTLQQALDLIEQELAKTDKAEIDKK